MANADPSAGLSDRFALFIVGLCGLLGHYEARERTAGPFVFLIRELLQRRLDRFAALVARFRAGKLAVVPAPRPASRSGVYDHPWDPMPRNRAWLWQLVPGVPESIATFESMLADPEMMALIAAGPQAGRLLRPLWWMMSASPLPAILRAPPRARPAAAWCADAGAADDAPASGGVAPPRAALPRPERPRPRAREIRRIAPLPVPGPVPGALFRG